MSYNFSDAKNIDFKSFIESNFFGKSIKLNGKTRFNPCPICGGSDCFTIDGENKFYCYSCTNHGDILDLLVKTGRAKDLPEACQQVGLSSFVGTVKNAFSGTVTGYKEEPAKAVEPAKEKKEVKLDIHSSALAKSSGGSLLARIRACKQTKTEATAQAKEETTTKTVEPIKEELAGNYFQSRGLSNEVIAKYGLKEESGYALLPCGIKRNITEKKYYNPSATEVTLFNLHYLEQSGIVFVTEGIFDALSLETLGYNAISLNSASNVKKFTAHLEAINCKAILVSAFDTDKAGKTATEELQGYCKANGITLATLSIKEGFKDVNEWLIESKDILLSSLLEMFKYQSQEDIFNQLLNQKRKEYISSGIEGLDKALGGGFIPDLYAIGGTPGAGKSAFVLQMAQGISESGRKVLYCSTELSISEVTARNISRISYQVNSKKFLTALEVNSGNLTPEKRELFFSLSETFSKKMRNFNFPKRYVKSVQDVKNEVHLYKVSTGDTPVIILDYIQNLQGTEKQTEKQVIDNAVLELKKLSNELDTPVIFVSSLNREGYNSSGMASYKESGAIEYSAAVAIIVRQTDNGKASLQDKQRDSTVDISAGIETEIAVVKNRHYMPMTTILSFVGAGNSFIKQVS